jgi:hypothetical protein
LRQLASKLASKLARKKEINNTRSFGMGSLRDFWPVDLPMPKCMSMSMKTRMHLDSDLLMRALA